MTQPEYLELIEKYPKLTSHGYGVQRDPHLGSTHEETFNNMRQELQGSLQAFNECVNWIQAHPDFESGSSSYLLKHEVENWLREIGRYRYIPQGAMILAALHKGLTLKHIPNDLGVFVG